MRLKHKQELLKVRTEQVVYGNRALTKETKEEEAGLEARRCQARKRRVETSHYLLSCRIDQLFAGNINVNRSVSYGCD
jgi:hypothetical protein